MTPRDHHRDRNVRQAGEAIDLVRDKIGRGAFLDAALGFQAGRAAGRRARNQGAERVLALPQVGAPLLLIRGKKLQGHPGGFTKRFLVLQEKRQARQFVERHNFHADETMLMGGDTKLTENFAN